LGEPRAEPQEAHDELAQLRQQLWQGTNGWDQWIPIEAEVIHHDITLFHNSSTLVKSLFHGLTFAK
jgi:predicted aminopeptidase